MKKSRLLKRYGVGAIVVGIALTLAVMGTGTAAIGAGRASARSSSIGTTPLTIVGSPDGPFTDNFNPFFTSSVTAEQGMVANIYEPLMQYDLVKSGVIYPWLAKAWAWSDSGRKLTLTIRQGIKWSDGTPLSASDVAYTFQLVKKYPALNTQGVVFSGAAATSSTTVVISFSTPGYAQQFAISQVYIVPQHIWSKIANPTTYTNPSPVGSGPFLLKSYSSQEVALTRNPNYWQAGEPKVPELLYPAYDSNTSADLALEDGQIDWASLYIEDYQKLFLGRSSYNGLYNAPVGDWNICPNLTVSPLNNVVVRRALDEAVNRPAIIKLGESGYYDLPATSATGLITPNWTGNIAPAYKNDTLRYAPSAAKSLLESIGFKMGSGGILNMPNGSPFTLSLVLPAPFTDWVTDANLIKEEMAVAGIGINIQTVSFAEYSNDEATGSYGLTFCGEFQSYSPEPLLSYLLDDSLTAPVGKAAVGDPERWRSPATESAIRSFSSSLSASVQSSALDELEGQMVNDVPVIPLMFQAGGGEYTSKAYVGWPSPSNPYELDSPAGKPWDEVVILHLSPRS